MKTFITSLLASLILGLTALPVPSATFSPASTAAEHFQGVFLAQQRSPFGLDITRRKGKPYLTLVVYGRNVDTIEKIQFGGVGTFQPYSEAAPRNALASAKWNRGRKIKGKAWHYYLTQQGGTLAVYRGKTKKQGEIPSWKLIYSKPASAFY